MNKSTSPNKQQHLKRLAIAAGLAASLSGVSHVAAQGADPLLNKLVSKGILTASEAEELRNEGKKDFDKAYAAKTGMPDWVKTLRIGGEFRGRYEGFYVDNEDFNDRNRFRYRARIGATATLTDDFEVGLRFMSGEPANGSATFGGDPLSGNSTLQDNGSKKFIYMDLAYAKWSPIHTGPLNGAFTIGKMEMPLAVSELVFDDEYTPEGFGAQLAYKFNPEHTLKLNGGAFVLDELSSSVHDPYMFGAQARWDAAWNKTVSSSFGLTALSLHNAQALVNGGVPNITRGNSRDAAGAPATHFNPINVDAAVTYNLASFPGYKGAFPIKVAGEYMVNPAADDRDTAYAVGFQLGKAGKRGGWELSYRWKSIEGDAWYEEVIDADFGAYYAAQMPNAGFTSASNPTGAGFGAGTNVRGHIFKCAYSPTDSLTVSLTYFLTELIDEIPAGSESDAGRLQLSALWKF